MTNFTKIFCISLFFIGSLLANNLAFGSTNESSNTNQLNQILTKGKLTVALPNYDAPGLFGVNNKGKLEGYDIDLAQNIANKLGVKIEFNRQGATFDDAVNMVAKGNADIAICNLSKTLDRAKKILYSNTYATFYQTILVNELWLSEFDKNPFTNKDPVKQILQKEKFSLGVLNGSSYVEFAKHQFSNTNIKLYPTNDALFAALEKNEIQALLHDDFDIKMRIVKQPGLSIKFKMLVLPTNKDLIAIGIAKNSIFLQNWLNLYLELENITMDADKILAHNSSIPS